MKLRNNFVLDDRTVDLLSRIKSDYSKNKEYKDIIHRALEDHLGLILTHLNDFSIRPSCEKETSITDPVKLTEEVENHHPPHTNHIGSSIGSEHFGYSVSMNSTGSAILTEPPNDRPSTELKSEGLSGIIMIDLEDWEKRVLQEKDQLDQRIEKLESFLKSRAVVETIPHVQKQMMEDQLKTMIEYSEILNDRVAVSLSTKLYELMGIKEPINTHYS